MPLDNVHAFQRKAHGLAKQCSVPTGAMSKHSANVANAAASSLARDEGGCYIAAALVEFAN